MKFLKVLLVIAVLVLAVVGVNTILIRSGIETPLSHMSDSVTTSAANALIDSTNMKGKAENALRANAGSIANKTGLPLTVVNGMIDDLDIQNWTVTTLPKDANATGQTDIDYEGTSATVTTYDDPSLVTINAGGAEVTFDVPSSAQQYLPYLNYL